MGEAVPLPLKFQIGARTLMAIQRSLVRVPLTLDDVLADRAPVLPMLSRSAHGYSVTSLPLTQRAAVIAASGGMIAFERQRYTRYYADLTIGFDAWMAQMSANARSQLKRKAKRVAAESGGTLDVRRYRTPQELESFHDTARRISMRTYQERLLGGGLPDTSEFLDEMVRMAAAGRVRAWLLFIGGEPAAYLYCPVDGGDVRYEHVGHDPAFNDYSPGSVLMMEAMRDLYGEGGLNRFDFTQGEGQHKRQMATAGVECCDLLLLRPSLANRVTTLALGGFNAGVSGAKAVVGKLGLSRAAKRVRRG